MNILCKKKKKECNSNFSNKNIFLSVYKIKKNTVQMLKNRAG